MTEEANPKKRWEKLKVELKQYNAAEREIWGDIDEGLVAKYAAGEAAA